MNFVHGKFYVFFVQSCSLLLQRKTSTNFFFFFFFFFFWLIGLRM